MAVVDNDIQAWQALLPDRADMRPWLSWFVGSSFARVRPGIGHDCKVDKRSITKGTVVSTRDRHSHGGVSTQDCI